MEPQQPTFLPQSEILGPLSLVTAPTLAVITLAEAKSWLREDRAAFNAEITALVERATEYVEREIPGHRQIRQATLDAPVRCWWEDELRLPRPPLSSVTSITYYDSNGDSQTLDSSTYLVRTPWRMPGTIERAPGESWPAVQDDRRYPITIRFVAGYAAGSYPGTVGQAIRFLVCQWFDHRMPLGEVTKEAMNTVHSLLDCESWGSYQ
jgi:uncharacterized phiE125 gp8 family phage protein